MVIKWDEKNEMTTFWELPCYQHDAETETYLQHDIWLVSGPDPRYENSEIQYWYIAFRKRNNVPIPTTDTEKRPVPNIAFPVDMRRLMAHAKGTRPKSMGDKMIAITRFLILERSMGVYSVPITVSSVLRPGPRGSFKVTHSRTTTMTRICSEDIFVASDYSNRRQPAMCFAGLYGNGLPFLNIYTLDRCHRLPQSHLHEARVGAGRLKVNISW